MLSGTMMHMALQVGLHMPDYAQDFSKNHLSLRHEDLKDRYATWAACNVVAQRYEPDPKTLNSVSVAYCVCNPC
jgi:hypothetical protein